MDKTITEVYTKRDETKGTFKCMKETQLHQYDFQNQGVLGVIYVKKGFANGSTKFRVTIERLD